MSSPSPYTTASDSIPIASASSKLSIAIIGAGPAGLTVASILCKHGFAAHIKIYDAEESATARDQGGSLDLHHDTGLAAIEQAGLMEEFKKHARYEGELLRICDKHGRLWYDETDDAQGNGATDAEQDKPARDHHTSTHDTTPTTSIQDPSNNHNLHKQMLAPDLNDPSRRPEIDRTELKNLLRNSIPPSLIQWGCKLIRTDEQTSNDGCTSYWMEFANGRQETAHIVIGADGAWSRTRPLVTHTGPSYLGVTFVDLTLTNVSRQHPACSKLVGPGTLSALGDNKGILAQMNGNDTIRIYVAIRVGQTWLHDTSSSGGAYLNNTELTQQQRINLLIQQMFDTWDESLLQLIRQAAPDTMITRQIYGFPIDHALTRDGNQHMPCARGVTLIGDAAHLMSPFAGEGVNLAMIDGASLASCMIASGGLTSAASSSSVSPSSLESLYACFPIFEKQMFERASQAARESAHNMELMLSKDAPDPFVQLFQQMMAKHVGNGQVTGEQQQQPTTTTTTNNHPTHA